MKIPAAGPCVMKDPATMRPCGERPGGWFELMCCHEHREEAWLCLRHGREAVTERPAALCEACFATRGHPDGGRCRMKIRMLAAG
jgi:hypothetical protein